MAVENKYIPRESVPTGRIRLSVSRFGAIRVEAEMAVVWVTKWTHEPVRSAHHWAPIKRKHLNDIGLGPFVLSPKRVDSEAGMEACND